jgi:hypothetical protein
MQKHRQGNRPRQQWESCNPETATVSFSQGNKTEKQESESARASWGWSANLRDGEGGKARERRNNSDKSQLERGSGDDGAVIILVVGFFLCVGRELATALGLVRRSLGSGLRHWVTARDTQRVQTVSWWREKEKWQEKTKKKKKKRRKREEEGKTKKMQ